MTLCKEVAEFSGQSGHLLLEGLCCIFVAIFLEAVAFLNKFLVTLLETIADIFKEDKPWANLPADECDVQRIAATFRAYENGILEDVKGFCKVATIEEIGKQDWVLTPGRYVGIADEEEDAEPFEEKMARLTAELGDLFAESHRLEAGIREKLAGIGFNVK